MSRFTAPLVVTPLNDGKSWLILYSSDDEQRFAYEVGAEGSGIVIEPPARFVTDFASIPRFLWWLLPAWGRYGQAAVIHDYLYGGGTIVWDTDEPMSLSMELCIPPTRKNADQIMLEAMGVLNVKLWKKRLIYRGVRLGGWYAWRKNRR